MTQTKTRLFFLFLLLISISGMKAQETHDPTVVRFVNQGAMHVASNAADATKAVIYIPDGVKMIGQSSILQHGITCIGGNFYQNSETNAFSVPSDWTGLVSPATTGTGKVVFITNHGDDNVVVDRRITTRGASNTSDAEEAALASFTRASNYIAFPEIEIRTTDLVVIPAKMGIDANKVTREPDAGKILLESTPYTEGAVVKAYDASLRLTGDAANGSSDLVSAGSVIVERNVSPYRIEDETTGAGPMFAFASPIENMRSGYFAGNWIRKLIPNKESMHGHVTYVYGNQSSNGTIIKEQYLYDPEESFINSQGYIVRMRANSFGHEDLKDLGGLVITGADPAHYDKDEFVFNGEVYTLTNKQNEKQLFARNTLYNQSVDLASNIRTTNWVIGNSYTAPISIDAIEKIMLEHPSIYFVSELYLLPPGQTTYQTYTLFGENGGMELNGDISEIPAMSYFMIRLDKNYNQTGTLALNKNDILTHGNAPHAMRAPRVYDNEVVFRVSPVSNPNIYDLAGIALRENGSLEASHLDQSKIASPDLFYLYTLSSDEVKLATNILPKNTEKYPLYFYPNSGIGRFRLEASRMESLNSEGLWLEDLKSGKIMDMLNYAGGYEFEAEQGDAAGRFMVHFVKPVQTGIHDLLKSDIRAYYDNNHVVVEGLTGEHTGSVYYLIDMQGRVLEKGSINKYPRTEIPTNLTSGVYLFRLEGKDSLTLKITVR